MFKFKPFDALFYKDIFYRPVESDLQTHTLPARP